MTCVLLSSPAASVADAEFIAEITDFVVSRKTFVWCFPCQNDCPTSNNCCVLECNVWRSDPDTQQRATWTFSKNDFFQLKLIHMRYKSFTLLGWLAKRATGSDSDTAA